MNVNYLIFLQVQLEMGIGMDGLDQVEEMDHMITTLWDKVQCPMP